MEDLQADQIHQIELNLEDEPHRNRTQLMMALDTVHVRYRRRGYRNLALLECRRRRGTGQ